MQIYSNVLDFPLDVCEAIIETLELNEPGTLEPGEQELLDALREARPLLIEINQAKKN